MRKIIEFREFSSHPDTTIRQVMEAINSRATAYQFQLILDSDGWLLGTITDGDIRRAILRGVELTASATECMFHGPTVGKMGKDRENFAKVRSLVARTRFLPVLDVNGKLAHLLVNDADSVGGVRALIMAGGFGKRLGSRTKSKPKPLISVGGRPILEHLIEGLEASNVTEIYISVHYLSEQIERFIRDRETKVPVQFLHEEEPLGTAGAVGLLPEDISEQFIITNADVLTQLDYGALRDFHFQHECDATIAVAQHEVKIPFGVVRHSDDGRFLGIDEKPTLTHFVAAGIYCMSPAFRKLVRRNERLDMPELLERGRNTGLKADVFPIHEYWTDVGRPEDLERADASHSNNDSN
jgi:dTDP-glucose pyrophosphorylase